MGELSIQLLLLCIPLIGGVLALYLGETMKSARAVTVTSAGIALAQSTVLVCSWLIIRGGEESSISEAFKPLQPEEYSLGIAQWGIAFNLKIDAATLWLSALTVVVVFCAALFTAYAKRERPGVFVAAMWWSAAALIGLFMARDLVVFYVFFELMLIPLFLLVGVWGGPERIRATMTMFIYTLLGSLPMLVAVVAVGDVGRDALATMKSGDGSWQPAAFDLDFLYSVAATDASAFPSWILALFIFAFAVKAPLVPFHGWLPLAYRTAPAEVSAVLSGLVSKAAMVGMLLVVLPLFPHQLAGGWGLGLTVWALVSLVYGAICAFRQSDARGVVAYSSIAQMGLIVLGLSVAQGAVGLQGVAGSYLQAINHGLISAALFLLVGIVEVRTGSGELSVLGRIAQNRPVITTTALFLAMIALAVPGANTFAGEFLILSSVFSAGWQFDWLLGAVAGATVVFAALYALRLLSSVMHNPDDVEEARTGTVTFGGDLSHRELVFLAPLLVAILALSVWPNAIRGGMERAEFRSAATSERLVAKGESAHEAGSEEGLLPKDSPNAEDHR